MPDQTQNTSETQNQIEQNPNDVFADAETQKSDNLDQAQKTDSPQQTPSTDENNQEQTATVDFKEDKVEQGPKQKRQHKPFFLLKIFILIFVIALVAASIFGIWNRWFRYDDEKEFISNWQINGTNQTVPIDAKTITLNSETVLQYTIDSNAKVINYTIGEMSGQSHYRFSWDRNQLAIIENTACDPISTALSDLRWFWDWSTCGMSKIDLSPAYTKNNKDEVDTQYTGLDDIMQNGATQSILLDKISTKTTNQD